MQARELLQGIKSNKAPVIVDTCSEMEFRKGRIPGAINAPVRKILLNRAQLPQDKSREMVITCMHGQRAMMASSCWASTDTATRLCSKDSWRTGRLPGCRSNSGG